MPGSNAILYDHLPTPDGGRQPYKAAGKLLGRKVLISGTDSGTGMAIAVLFAMEGAESTIVYLPEEEGVARQTERLVVEKGGTVHLIKADLSDPQACQAVFDKAVESMGRVNILILNHGAEVMKESIEEVTEDGWTTTFNSNAYSFSVLSSIVIPHMVPGDTVIACASITPYLGRPDLHDYTESRTAILAFTHKLAAQEVSRGVRINAVCQGMIWSPPVLEKLSPETQGKFKTPLGRPGQPSEVATCVVFLAGPDSSFITGQCLHPNGDPSGGTLTEQKRRAG